MERNSDSILPTLFIASMGGFNLGLGVYDIMVADAGGAGIALGTAFAILLAVLIDGKEEC